MKRKNDERDKTSKLVRWLILIFSGAVLLCAAILGRIPNCSKMPEVLEYPEAGIIKAESFPSEKHIEATRYTYETSASYDDVLRFYQNNLLQCVDVFFPDEGHRMTCNAQPETYMRYFVKLEPYSETPYHYTLELVWDKRCGDV